MMMAGNAIGINMLRIPLHVPKSARTCLGNNNANIITMLTIIRKGSLLRYYKNMGSKEFIHPWGRGEKGKHNLVTFCPKWLELKLEKICCNFYDIGQTFR